MKKINLDSLIKISSFGALLGWGLIHLFWDPPYRTLLWSHTSLGWFVQSILQIDWNSYVTSNAVEFFTQAFIKSIGLFLICAAGLSLFSNAKKTKWILPLIGASGVLLVIAFLLTVRNDFQFGMLIEYSAQMCAPILVAATIIKKIPHYKLITSIKIMIAFTFLGHGLYAIGYYPVPGGFVDMTINILGVNEVQARNFLKIFGALDLCAAILLFVPKVSKAAIFYTIFWGILTTLARPVSAMALSLDFESISKGLTEAIIRTPHWILPIYTLKYSNLLSEIKSNYLSQKTNTKYSDHILH